MVFKADELFSGGPVGEDHPRWACPIKNGGMTTKVKTGILRKLASPVVFLPFSVPIERFISSTGYSAFDPGENMRKPINNRQEFLASRPIRATTGMDFRSF